MNVDISPDGKTLIFDLLGNLYKVPVSGGNAIPITNGLSIKSCPVWASDGKYVAYLSDLSGALHLTVQNAKGEGVKTLSANEKPLYFSEKPLWLPHGSGIAIGNFIYTLDGRKTPVSFPDYPTWVATGKHLAYYIANDTLHGYNLVEQKVKVMLACPKWIRDPVLSPDNERLIYLADTANTTALICYQFTTKTKTILVRSPWESGQRLGFHYAFSPDSKYIYLGYRGKLHGVKISNGEDKVIPFKAKVRIGLSALNYNIYRLDHNSFKVNYTRSASMSPDGKKVAFTTLNKIYIKDLPNGVPHLLANQSVSQYQPAWSPDGKWITYVSWSDTSGGFLFKVPSSGGIPEKITKDAGEYQRPVWSPDGKTIAVIKGGSKDVDWGSHAKGQGRPTLGDRDDTGSGQLQLISFVDGSVKAIADSVPLWNHIEFYANGQRLIYQPEFAGGNTLKPVLISRNLDGRDQQIIAKGIYDRSYWIPQRTISPSGRYLVYSLAEDLYLISTQDGSTPVICAPGQGDAVCFASGVDPHWENGGKTLSWTYGNKLYRINPDKIIPIAKKTEERYIAIDPVQIIDLSLTAPKAYGQGLLALTHVRVVTMQGQKVIENGTVIIKDGRFLTVGAFGAVKIPSGAKIYNLPGKTIMPGFVDLHLHIRLQQDIFPQQSWMYLANLAYGVTTARDPSSSYDSFGYAELVETGQMLGPRLFSSGRPARFDDGITKLNSLADARRLVAKRKQMGAVFIKQYELPTRQQRQWLLQASNEAGLNMTNEGGTAGWLPVLAMIKDGSTGVEHNPEWSEVYDDIVQFVAKSKFFFTPTLQVTANPEAKQYFNFKYWHAENAKLKRFMPDSGYLGPQDNRAESYNWITKGIAKDTFLNDFLPASKIDARIRKAGGIVTLGSHGNDQGIGVHNELWALQMGGISNMQALQAATIMGAEALGVQKDIGSIEVGKIADLIILNKNPLKDIHNSREIKYVMKDGILYDGDTLDEIWPVQKKCPEWRLKTN